MKAAEHTAVVRLFKNDLKAVFLRRPNRFLITAHPAIEAEAGAAKKDGKELACHCPNPGRLSELLFPGAELILEKRSGPGTPWTAAALKRDSSYKNAIVPLCSSRANDAAEKLILKEIIPGLAEICREYSIGGSRFDFLCRSKNGKQHLVEVKACSLVEHGAAMFPDAPSARALKHLEELIHFGKEGFICHVLFVIMHGDPKVFIPNLHTDPAFAAAIGCSAPIKIHAALIRCEENGMASLVKKEIPISLDGKLAAADSGSYLVILEISEPCTVEIGSLGKLSFKAGWYVYSGSALKNLSARTARHQRKIRKRKHWHIDYLTPHAKTIKTLAIRSFHNLECDLALDLKKLGGLGIDGFGCSDCAVSKNSDSKNAGSLNTGSSNRCKSHLFYFSSPPGENRNFHDMLFMYRHVKFRKNP